ncbi:MAG: hypothetical protein DMG69_02975 [Acidobacteria bacterium]|nr:MAG: hypothetical protein DMG69_02975 [Acidobacteriota bacterium]
MLQDLAAIPAFFDLNSSGPIFALPAASGPREIYLIHITGNRAVPGLWLSAAAACGLVAALIGKPDSASTPDTDWPRRNRISHE